MTIFSLSIEDFIFSERISINWFWSVFHKYVYTFTHAAIKLMADSRLSSDGFAW